MQEQEVPNGLRLEDNPRYDYGLRVFSTLKTYWQTLYEHTNQIPTRAQFNPAELKNILRYIYMTEQLPDGSIYIRHKGTGLDNPDRPPFVSTDHLKEFGGELPGTFEAYFDALFSGPCAEVSRWISSAGSDTVIDFICFSLPLYGKTKAHRIALGVVIPSTSADLSLLTLGHGTKKRRRICSKFIDIGFGKPEGLI